MSNMHLPGFTSEAVLNSGGKRYWAATRSGYEQQVVPQSRNTCAFKAGRLAGRCLAAGFDHGDCMGLAADFNSFCNEHDL
jgi:hypothetical protein